MRFDINRIFLYICEIERKEFEFENKKCLEAGIVLSFNF